MPRLGLALAPRLSDNRNARFNGLRFRKLRTFQQFLWVAKAGRLLTSYGSNYQLPQIWQFMKEVEFRNETRARGGNKGKEGVFKPQHNMKRLRMATTGHGAASWQIFCAELAILQSVCAGCFQNQSPTMCFPRRLWQRISRNVEQTW